MRGLLLAALLLCLLAGCAPACGLEGQADLEKGHRSFATGNWAAAAASFGKFLARHPGLAAHLPPATGITVPVT